jgi:hypothetical protein
MIEAYLSGRSIRSIATERGTSYGYIRACLLRADVTLRGVGNRSGRV